MLYRKERRAFLGGLAATCLATTRGHAMEPAGAVETSKGECYAVRARERQNLASTAKVFVNDAVNTGQQSALSLRLGTATEVRLGPQARLLIDRFLVNVGGVLVLERGAMLYDHDPASGPSDMAVRSPFGLLAVRGTRFFAGPSNGVFGVFVQRGSVTVVGGQKAVLVEGGFGTDIAFPGAEPGIPSTWGAGRISRALASVE